MVVKPHIRRRTPYDAVLSALRAQAARYGPWSLQSLLSPAEIALRCGADYHAMQQALSHLRRQGVVLRVRHGWYRIGSIAPTAGGKSVREG